MKQKLRMILKILGLAGVYIMAAKLGLSLAYGVKQITTVWPPSGLAIAALILFGFDLWPGIFLGAIVANLLTNEPFGVALGIAIGNTLEAVIGMALLRQVLHFRPDLSRIKGVVGLAGLAAGLSTMVSASIGTTSLAMGGLLPWRNQAAAWLLWWFGDMAGVLLFAPVLLVWLSGWRQVKNWNKTELAALVLGVVIVSILVFFGYIKLWGNPSQLSYVIFPFTIWAAFRFKQLGVTAVSIITAIIAVMGTVAGHGPFTGYGTTQQQLTSLLVYIILISTTGLFMAVAVLQRESYEQKLIHQAAELERARDKILLELNAKSEREGRLADSNQRITRILSRLLDESPQRYKPDD